MFVRRVAALLACVTALSVVPGTAAADPIENAKKRLVALAKKVQDAEAREGLLSDRMAKLDKDMKATERELDAIRQRFGVRMRAAYESGVGGDPIMVMLTTDDPGAVVAKLDLLNAAYLNDE